MSIHYRIQGSLIVVFGNTFQVKDLIKNLGGRFEGVGKTWRIPLTDDSLDQVDRLCRSYGGGSIAPIAPIAPIDQEVSDQALLESRSPRPPLAHTPHFPAVSITSSVGVGALEGQAPTHREAALELKAITVRQLLDRAYRVINQAFTESFWIVGELQNLSTKPSGMFFDLAEARDGEGSEDGNVAVAIPGFGSVSSGTTGSVRSSSATLTIRCVLWRESLQTILKRHGQEAAASALQDGLKVAIRCKVQFYRDRAQLSLVVEDLDPSYTKGALALQREKLLAELRAKGLDRANGRLDFPVFPFDVGLISAEGSRAYSDFTHQLESLGFPGRIWFCSSPMQGDGVPQGVVAAIQELCAKKCDVIVITRGGGSAADLRWFDDPKIAYGIAQSKVPIIAAIGHHDDRCVAEEVCYQRQKTPTAAADFLVGCFEAARRRIEDASQQLVRGMTRRRDGFAEETNRLGEKIGILASRSLDNRRSQWFQIQNQIQRRAVDLVNQALGVAQYQQNNIYMIASQRLSQQKETLSDYQHRLAQKDPRPWMLQGWTQLTTLEGLSVKHLDHAALGVSLKARLLDGILQLQVTGRVPRSPNALLTEE